jgi:hypothetical protein
MALKKYLIEKKRGKKGRKIAQQKGGLTFLANFFLCEVET